jgi:hypothetical protein
MHHRRRTSDGEEGATANLLHTPGASLLGWIPSPQARARVSQSRQRPRSTCGPRRRCPWPQRAALPCLARQAWAPRAGDLCQTAKGQLCPDHCRRVAASERMR